MSRLDAILAATAPIRAAPSGRLPLLVWPAMDADFAGDAEARDAIRELAARGIALISTWDPVRRAEVLDRGLRAARIQRDLGLMTCVNATPALHRFCNGEESTAHVDAGGAPFFDFSFDPKVPMGCPFSLQHRVTPMRERVEGFAGAYARHGLPVHLAFADWEVDGPIEWNGAWDASKRCVRCRERIPGIESFDAFQGALRRIRADLQRVTFADVLKARFPGVLVGNYGVYPHDGYRYWYDYFERFVEGAPHRKEEGARYRRWYPEFPLTGYTMAMPVVYPWKTAFPWYAEPDRDFRWFRFMLLSATNAGRSAPPGLPVVPFVHWHAIDVPDNSDPAIPSMSADAYRELLWHMLLRGHDGLFLWCTEAETAEEVVPVHEVYAASLEYGDFLEHGTPVVFDIPREAGPVVSAVQWKNRLLVRRTDFTDDARDVALAVEGFEARIPRAEGRCRILEVS